MAITIDATVGGASSNSFGSEAEAELYFEARMYSTAWTNLSAEAKKQALIMATQQIVIDTCWTGAPTTTTQALPWPRTGMTDRMGNAIPDNVIPQDLKNAQFEMALLLAKSDRTAESDIEVLGLTKLKAGPVELNFSGDASASVVNNYIKSLFPKSWLCPEEETDEIGGIRKIVFEAF